MLCTLTFHDSPTSTGWFGNESNLLIATFSSLSSLSEATSLTGDGATVISEHLVAFWMSCLNLESESESEITVVTIMCSGAHQQKEGRQSESLSSTVYNCSTVSPHTHAGGTK